MLKDEIGESGLRLKAAKCGHPLKKIVPDYDNTFYMPDRTKFKVKQPQNRNRLLLHYNSHSVNLPKISNLIS